MGVKCDTLDAHPAEFILHEELHTNCQSQPDQWGMDSSYPKNIEPQVAVGTWSPCKRGTVPLFSLPRAYSMSSYAKEDQDRLFQSLLHAVGHTAFLPLVFFPATATLIWYRH